jgi:ABC-type sugar transport system ATPase subunit
MASLTLDNVVKQYGRVTAVHRMSFTVADGEFLALLGPSGCGKTSTMRMIAGLEDITDGEIRIDGKVVNSLEPAGRQIAMSFEHYGLYPHLTLFGNIAYPLTVRGVAERDVKRQVFEVASLLHIEEILGSFPKEVSSGVQQRVSLARALVRSPSVFLLDEPLSHLDADLRARMRGELKRLQKVKRSTMVYVTHDQLEAMTMADRIAIMNQGRLQQLGTPNEIYERPANRFVATFIGEPPMNMIDATVDGGPSGVVLRSADGGTIAALDAAATASLAFQLPPQGACVAVGVRPTDIDVVRPQASGLPASVRLREFRGDDLLMTFDGAGTRLRAIVRRDLPFQPGDRVGLVPRADRLHLFSADTGDAIGHTEDSRGTPRQRALHHSSTH